MNLFQKTGCLCLPRTLFHLTLRYTRTINASINSPQLRTVPSDHDRNISYHWKDSSVAPAVCPRASSPAGDSPEAALSSSVPCPTRGYSPPSLPWLFFPWKNAEGWKTATWGPEPWKDVVGVQGKQSERPEKAAPLFPRPGPTRRGRSGSRQPGHRPVWLPKPGGQTMGPERMAASFLPVECSAWVSKFNSAPLRSNTRLSRTGENQQRAILGHFQLHLSQGAELWSHPAQGRGGGHRRRPRVCGQAQ